MSMTALVFRLRALVLALVFALVLAVSLYDDLLSLDTDKVWLHNYCLRIWTSTVPDTVLGYQKWVFADLVTYTVVFMIVGLD